MQSNKKNKQLEEKLPRGSKKIIAKKTGLSSMTVSRFFNGENVSFETEYKIVKEAVVLLELLKESEEAKQALLNYGL